MFPSISISPSSVMVTTKQSGQLPALFSRTSKTTWKLKLSIFVLQRSIETEKPSHQFEQHRSPLLPKIMYLQEYLKSMDLIFFSRSLTCVSKYSSWGCPHFVSCIKHCISVAVREYKLANEIIYPSTATSAHCFFLPVKPKKLGQCSSAYIIIEKL